MTITASRRAILCIMTFAILFASFRPKTQKVIFFGDSITQLGAKPGGYIVRMKDALDKKNVGSDYDLIGAGIGGNKVYDLYLRMDDDVLALNPDIVFIFVGVNDVWHKALFATGTDAEKFEKFYTAIINKCLDRHIRLYLVTPAVIGEKTDYTNQQDGDLNAYSQIIRNLAQKFHTGLVDLREIFHTYELKNNPGNKESGILTVDRVHLNDAGNQLVADNFTDALLSK
ncbi:MAG TPA: GDSL-type esterase/lipase family protein [Puia sp.]|jgi:lysophospholipase L1-like esterase|nr:GDSL-type esterase/lipase family protein [Puia sp.]